MSTHLGKAGNIFRGLGNCAKKYVLGNYERTKWTNTRRALGLNGRATPSEILNAPYCFVLSTGRCGTALLTQLLSAQNKLLVEHNPEPVLEYAASRLHAVGVGKDAAKIAILAARFDVCFQEAFERGRIYVETNNRITFFSEALAELLPNAIFIHLVRHPGDFVRSGLRRGYYDGSSVQHQRLDGEAKVDAWAEMSRIEKIGWEWSEINSACELFKRKVSGERVISVKSEDLFGKPTAIHDIFEFIKVDDPFRSESAQKKLMKLLGRPINAQKEGSFPRFANWTANEKSQLRKETDTIASLYGYDLR